MLCTKQNLRATAKQLQRDYFTEYMALKFLEPYLLKYLTTFNFFWTSPIFLYGLQVSQGDLKLFRIVKAYLQMLKTRTG